MAGRIIRLAALTLALLIPAAAAGRTPGDLRPQSGGGASDPVPSRLLVKVIPEALAPGTKSATVDIEGLKEEGSAFGPTAITPLLPPPVLAAVRPGAPTATLPPGSRVFEFDFPASANLDSIKHELEAQPWVEYAEYDRLMQLFDGPADPLFLWQWGLENTGQTFPTVDRLPGYFNDTLAWVSGVPGADVGFRAAFDHSGPRTTAIVGILDTGSDIRHEDLAGSLWQNPGEIPDNAIDDDHNGYVDDYLGYDFSGDAAGLPNELIPDSDPTDSIGHGSHVAGIVAAATNNALGIAGVAPYARIMTLKVFPNAFNSVVARAIYYGVENGADVFNMSFGSPFESQTMSDALAHARARGVLPVVAAGNSGAEDRNYPSADISVLSVGALDYTGHVTFFSTYGDYLDLVAPGAAILSLRAAGTDMYAENGEPDVHIIGENYYLADGTSMAAPHVAGCAAALLTIESGLSPDQVAQVLCASSVDLVDPYGTGAAYPGWDKYSGWGAVNLGRAINELAGITLRIDVPHAGDVISGTVVIEGTASGNAFTGYALEFGEGSQPTAWTPLVSSTQPVVADTLFQWNTGNLTGQYTLRLRSGISHEDLVTFTLANTAITRISSPQDGDTILLTAVVRGSTVAPDFLRAAISLAALEDPEDTATVWTGTRPVVNDSICVWMVDARTEGSFYLKLTTEAESATWSDSVLVYVKNPFRPGWPVVMPGYGFYASAAADLDRDGRIEFIVPTSKGMYVFEDDGRVADGWPRDTLISFQSIPAVGDLDQDTLNEIIVASANYLHVYTFFGVPYSLWPRDFTGRPNLFGTAAPLICDLDNQYRSDGVPEILTIDGGGVIRAFHDDGSEYIFSGASGPLIVDVFSTGAASVPQAAVADLDYDGQNELIVAGDGLWVWDAATGAPYHQQSPRIRDYYASYGMAVGNFNTDPELEIAVAFIPLDSRIFHVDVLKADGTSLPGWPVSTGLSDMLYLLNSLSAGDVDGDGLPEIFIAPYSLGIGYILAYRVDGTSLLPQGQNGQFIELFGSASPIALTDVTGDGKPEIVFKAGEFFIGNEYLYALTSEGDFVPGYPMRTGHGFGTQLSAALTADLEKDGWLNLLTLEGSGRVAAAWDFPVRYTGAGRPWPRFCRDNWNSSILPSLRHINPTYLVLLINYMFRSTTQHFPPYEHPDGNCDGKLSLTDLVIIVNYLYRGGPEPCLP